MHSEFSSWKLKKYNGNREGNSTCFSSAKFTVLFSFFKCNHLHSRNIQKWNCTCFSQLISLFYFIFCQQNYKKRSKKQQEYTRKEVRSSKNIQEKKNAKMLVQLFHIYFSCAILTAIGPTRSLQFDGKYFLRQISNMGLDISFDVDGNSSF